jgi:actin-related protein
VDDFTLKMEEFLSCIFEQELVISPKEKSIVLIYNYFVQDEITNTIAKLLFKKFEVLKISFLVGNVLPLYITGHFSGMVVDAGFIQTTVAPVYEGYSLLHVGGNIGLGSFEISRLLLKNLLAENQ